MKTPKQYNITPAKGQALLNFQGRLMPNETISNSLYETNLIEEVRSKKIKEQTLFDKEVALNADFTNLLFQGDCLSACSFLKANNIKLDLVYIDPPFASGANYAKKLHLRNGKKSEVETDDNSIGEEIMYGDIWQKEDFLNWLYVRLLAIKEIMNDTASIYVHLDWHIGHYVKILLDEVFGEDNFQREIVWDIQVLSGYKTKANNWIRGHDVIYYYSLSEERVFNKVMQEHTEKYINMFNQEDEDGRKFLVAHGLKRYLDEVIDKGKPIGDVWDNLIDIKEEINSVDKIISRMEKFKNEKRLVSDVWSDVMSFQQQPTSAERVDYVTQKPTSLLKRIIEASSNEGMIVADFFSGSGTTAEVANELNRKFIACDIGINALQTTRDRLVKAGASFDILKIQDGLRLFRNPAQTTAKIFGIIDGFKSRTDLNLNDFWDGGIAQAKGTYSPVKFSGIHDKLTKELLDVYLEEIYKLEDTTNKANEVFIIYAHKDLEIDQDYLNKQLNKTAKTELKVKLVSLDGLLGEKRDALFTPDNADIKISKQGSKYKVEIKKFFSPYLKNKIDDYNAKKTKKGTLEQDLSKAVKISSNGLELIEAVQFDTTLKKVWKSNPDLEDKAGIKEKIKGVYNLDTDKFKMKIRNIAGDEIIIDSEEIKK